MKLEAVRVDGVTKRFGRQRALAGVSLTLRRGRLCALLGPNGAGKSTLIGVLSMLVRPTSGRVVMGDPERPLEGRALRAAVGVLAHDSFVYGDLDALENLAFWGALYDVPDARRRAAALLDEVGLEPQARRRPARTYSRGMLQRLALARALLPDPQLLLLDEPFTGLDRGGAEALARALAAAKEAGRIVLCATHDVEALGALCDHVVVLRAGRVALDEERDDPYAADELRARYAASVA